MGINNNLGGISLNTIATEFGGSKPHGINEYYRGGSLVPVLTSTDSIPASGRIDFNDFWNTSKSVTYDLGLMPATGQDTNADKTYFGGEIGVNTWTMAATTGVKDKTITIPTPHSSVNRMKLRTTNWTVKIAGGIRYYSDAYSDWDRQDQIRDPGLALYNGTYGAWTQSTTDTNNRVAYAHKGNTPTAVGTTKKTVNVTGMSNVTVTAGKQYTMRYTCEFYRTSNGNGTAPGLFYYYVTSRPRIYVDTV